MQNKKAHERSHHRFTGKTRPSLRNGFNGFLRALLGDRALLPPSLTSLPVNLTPASGRQDHTTSPSAKASFVEHAFAHLMPPASTASPSPTFVTIASRPSFGDETLLIYRCFYLFAKRNIFGKGDGQPRDKIDVDLPVGQITQPALRHAHSMRSGICARAFSV